MSDFDLDASVDAAWGRFRTTLADRVATMASDDTVFVRPAQGDRESAPFAIRIGRRDGQIVRCTVACDAGAQSETLVRPGWVKLPDGRFISEHPLSLRDEIAGLVVRTLQQIWSVPDPSFLAGLGQPRTDESPSVDSDHLGPDRLRTLLLDELETYAGGAFDVNRDATIPLPTTQITSSIGVSPYAPRIDIFARIASNVTDRHHAESIVTDMAAAWPDIQLVLDRSDLYAAHLIDAETFSRDRFFAGLHHWFAFIDVGLPEIHRRLVPGEAVTV
ncbi:TY-Chap domain-containing protein [Gordonia sp. NPDC003424]